MSISVDNKEVKKNWIDTPYARAPWVPIQHGEIVEPPNEQRSNLKLADSEVMKSRTEETSNAFPLQAVDPYAGEQSGNKKTQDQ